MNEVESKIVHAFLNLQNITQLEYVIICIRFFLFIHGRLLQASEKFGQFILGLKKCLDMKTTVPF